MPYALQPKHDQFQEPPARARPLPELLRSRLMTIADLIKELQAYPASAPISSASVTVKMTNCSSKITYSVRRDNGTSEPRS